MNKYNHREIDSKWQEIWQKTGIYQTDEDPGKEKFYCLDMFPYPSGSGLHVGHPKGYIATDVISRMKRLQGYRVLHPMGWDAFGLPTENYAIKNKINPKIAADENVKRFKEQLNLIGFSYDWEREVNTTDPQFYKWTQWIFLKLFEKGLAYQSWEPINWCPSCKTGLSLEDLEGGKCERCGGEVEQRPMRQWVLKMTDYADRLLEDLKLLNWEEQIIEQQRNWIGRSEGARIKFPVDGTSDIIEVFTTRLDTIFGVTFMVLAPEHSMVLDITTPDQEKKVKAYIEKTKKKTELQRMQEKTKTGAFTGAFAINPASGEKIPIFIADYVLAHYGAGAIMAVPAHDNRDFEFAEKFKLPIKKVIKPPMLGKGLKMPFDKAYGIQSSMSIESDFYTGYGTLINSGKFNRLTSEDAIKAIAEVLGSENAAKLAVIYKMKDWVFSRQRYWGEPIPIVHCERCGPVAVPEKELPLTLPEIKSYEPTGTGESPLAKVTDWVNTKCPKCGGPGKRETDTMPQWAGSSWYYLRYIDPGNVKELINLEKEKKWMPVDLYVGGIEHATRHLLYARFWHKFLYDLGVVTSVEPFDRLIHVGLILAEDGRKMSKRWNNVINPDDIVAEYGADSLRVYEMFMGPFTQAIAWNMDGVKGARRFLEKVYGLYNKFKKEGFSENSSPKVAAELNKTIKKVTEDIEDFHFNTAISAMMSFLNVLMKDKKEMSEPAITGQTETISKNDFEQYIILLSPFAPHLAEEIWRDAGHAKSIFTASWPGYDQQLIVDEVITVPVQINGKVRDQLVVEVGISEVDILALAKDSVKTKKYLENTEIRKVIYIKDKLLSIVTR